eukprot:3277352-Rhodomonas_salina.1
MQDVVDVQLPVLLVHHVNFAFTAENSMPAFLTSSDSGLELVELVLSELALSVASTPSAGNRMAAALVLDGTRSGCGDRVGR